MSPKERPGGILPIEANERLALNSFLHLAQREF